VGYPMQELFAIVTLEAHREGTVIVGEDLGTDARPVRAAMERRGWYRTYVVQERALADPATALAGVPRESVASPNTHDTPPFAAFWEGLDERQRSGFAQQVGVAPDAGARAALEACAMALASSRGRAIVINLEDLWGETRPQNVPGTGLDVPNWRRRARHSLEDLRRMPEVLDTLSAVNARRTGKAAP
jgi:4-alpha-glucanotransferase